MSTASVFRSQRLEGRRLTLSFERIGDSYWTDVRTLRAMVAEFDRLGIDDKADVQLKHRTSDDEVRPAGWSLNLTTGPSGEAPDAA